ncbi:MAG: hypothetical protein IAE80_25245 [Anaerolinea sp.]|nr:hypothetical protein [Anaerolinea sp.]
MELANQFSYLLFGLGTLVALTAVLRWRRVAWRPVLLIGLLVVTVFTAGFLALRPGVSDVTDAAEAQALIGDGKPTLLEFYSNYCAGCMAVRPQVDALIAELGDTFNVLRIDIHTPVGRELRRVYGFTYSPEFVLFDADGRETWRSNSPPPAAELARISAGEITNTIQ